jgi:molybdopterin-synthase adenylyltransferase
VADRKVVVVGVGALGSHVVLLGRNWPVRFTAVDFDRVEQKNLLAQFHTKMGVGRNKAAALQQAAQGLFGLKIEAVPHRLGDDNVQALLGGADLVLDCVDNLPTRQVVQRFVRAQSPPIPCLHGAVAADGSYARLMWDPLFEGDAGGEGEATCEDGEHLPFIGIVAANLAALVGGFLKTGRQRSVHVHPGGLVEVG